MSKTIYPNKYTIYYQRLINRAKMRKLDCYTERHHIIPKCLGGADISENIVRLTPEEHYVAHQLLVKMFPDERGLVWAAIRMTGDPRNHRKGNKLYGWLRKRMATTPMTEAHKRKIGASRVGRKHSEESKRKMSKAHRGKKIAIETRKKISKANKGNKSRLGILHTEESKEKISKSRKGKPHGEEHRKNLAASQIGRIQSEETRKKISNALAGKKRGPRSPETKKRISDALKGRNLIKEHREKLR